ncbi:uncharacterized protein LOC144425523 [Styela clava]
MKLANISDVTHLNMLREYFRSKMNPESSLLLWTGMSYAHGKVISITGITISLPSEVWYPSSHNLGRIKLLVLKDSADIYQGLTTGSPAAENYGVLCEIAIHTTIG